MDNRPIMMASITAVTLSRTGVVRHTPTEVQHRVHQRTIDTVEELHAQRLISLQEVNTPWCFFLDSDDALPSDIGAVLRLCLSVAEQTGVKMVSTDELVITTQATTRNTAVHHLVLMHTPTVQQVAQSIPLGRHRTESSLYPKLAELGHAHVPEIGYHWHRANTGFHTNPYLVEARINSNRWCAEQQLKLTVY